MFPVAVKLIITIAVPTITAIMGYKKVKKLKKDWDESVKKRRKEIASGKNRRKWL